MEHNTNVSSLKSLFHMEGHTIRPKFCYRVCLIHSHEPREAKYKIASFVDNGTIDRLKSMGLWILEDSHLDHVPGTAPLADIGSDTQDGIFRCSF